MYGGHSMRIGGAQGLSRAGIETFVIALLARWGSSAVYGYIREAPLALAYKVAGQAVVCHHCVGGGQEGDAFLTT